jgi:MYXO-CTERM domain-containing protein
MRWARQSASGVAAARCDYADQFRSDDVPSDVTVALRDYVLVPDGNSGEVVLVDRVVTGDSARGLHYRVRSAGNFALADGRATAKVGASSLAVEPVYTSSGAPSVRAMPQGSECDSGDHACDVSRLSSGTEYRIDVAGPEAMAIHVITARGASENVAVHEQIQGTGYRGVVVERAAGPVAVITNAAADGATGSAFSYKAPSSALHVVLDAPTDAAGKSDITAKRDGTTCSVEVRAHQGSSGGFDGKPLVVRFDQDCAVSDDGTQMLPAPNGDPTPVAMGDGGAAGELQGASASAGEATSSLEPKASNGSSGGKGSGTGGTASTGTGGTFAMSGSSNGSTKNTEASATSEPTTPGMSSCSVSGTGRDGGPAGTLASLALGTLLLSRKRREPGFVRR